MLQILRRIKIGPVFQLKTAFLVEDTFFRPRMRGDIDNLPEFAKLLCSELGVCRTPSANNVDFPDLTLGQHVESVFGNVACPKFIDRLGQNSADIGSDVALANYHRSLMAQVEGSVAKIGVPVVPADKLGRTVISAQTGAWDRQGAILVRAAGKKHRMVRLLQLGDRNVSAGRDIAEKSEILISGNAVIDGDGLFEFGMIRRDAAPH